ncbi:MAG: radical SAM protein [Paracoccaceae bacterium]
MNDHTPIAKFSHPDITAKGEMRAQVALSGVKTLWFNTGTLCNVTCANCYIESSPENDRLVYMTPAEVDSYLDQIPQRGWPVHEIAFTGGEPFMNPMIIEILRTSLRRGYEVLVLTNAMRPMMRATMQRGLQALRAEFGNKLTLRISLDHFRRELHDEERGAGTYDITLQGMDWLHENGFNITVAGRTQWGDSEAESRAGYAALFAKHGYDIDAMSPADTVLFPEMDETVDVPEITTACWSILGKSPNDVMCATSRMVVKRKNAAKPVVLACTLLPYDPQFELGETLEAAETAIKLNHRHCAKFCVLGGASCSV